MYREDLERSRNEGDREDRGMDEREEGEKEGVRHTLKLLGFVD